ncbi:MAG: Sensory transduction protein regX3 [Chlamydiales bacterium]|nr:Sensory transduction protein regX3 [Chlamydiales bacterium]MCH9619796.1 Sensory transduction protein regX3 [Chlamydiales bacterium]MCH9623402.1 Sensory transduction protein regX3 [Chlamydiales bacterium]
MGRQILIIDDDEDITELLAFRLTKEGYTVTCTGSGKGAIEESKNGAFDLFILDRLLPDMRGEEIAKTLKSAEKTKEAPILFISGIAEGGEEEFSDHFLLKPYEWKDLIYAIGKLI